MRTKSQTMYEVHDGQHRLWALKELGLEDWLCDCKIVTADGTDRQDIPARLLVVDPVVQREAFSLAHAQAIKAALSNGHADLDALGQFSVSASGVSEGRRAEMFLRKSNSLRLNAIDKFRMEALAGAEYGHDTAEALNSALENAGYTVTNRKGPRNVRAVDKLRSRFKRLGSAPIIDGLAFYSSVWPDDEIHGIVLCGLIDFLNEFPQADRNGLSKRLASGGSSYNVVGRARERSGLLGGSIYGHASEAIREIYNRGRRNGKLGE